MQVVIDIPKKIFNEIREYNITFCGESFAQKLVGYIKNGTPLPKEHGDLVDRSKIYKAIPAEEDNCTGMGMTYDEMCAYNDGIDAMYDLIQGAKTIVKADKEEDKEEDKEIDR